MTTVDLARVLEDPAAGPEVVRGREGRVARRRLDALDALGEAPRQLLAPRRPPALAEGEADGDRHEHERHRRGGYPPGVAADMILSGESVDAEAAGRWGLVDRVVSRDEFEAAVEAEIERLLDADPASATARRRAMVSGAPRAGLPA